VIGLACDLQNKIMVFKRKKKKEKRKFFSEKSPAQKKKGKTKFRTEPCVIGRKCVYTDGPDGLCLYEYMCFNK